MPGQPDVWSVGHRTLSGCVLRSAQAPHRQTAPRQKKKKKKKKPFLRLSCCDRRAHLSTLWSSARTGVYSTDQKFFLSVRACAETCLSLAARREGTGGTAHLAPVPGARRSVVATVLKANETRDDRASRSRVRPHRISTIAWEQTRLLTHFNLSRTQLA